MLLEWPGWRFYASVDMSPNNSIWRDAPELMEYIRRSQSFLQYGEPDNDFLVYLPVRDMWHSRLKEGEKGLLMQFDIHSMSKKAPGFIKSILKIDSLGYDCDYISNRQLANVRIEGRRLITEGGTPYRGIIIPSGTTITPELQNLLSAMGDLVVYGEDETRLARLAPCETMKRDNRLRAIRRRNLTGNHYFIANLSGGDVNDWIAPAVRFRDAVWFNPMNGEITPATIKEGKIRFSLRSGESRILQTYNLPLGLDAPECDTMPAKTIDLTSNKWELSFIEECPVVGRTHKLQSLSSWESLGEKESVTMGTGVYTTSVKLGKDDCRRSWRLELGDVRESARVYINGKYAGCVWASPFVINCGDLLRKGKNDIRIEVTNLPANRIADLDRAGEEWRIMKEINVVDINYKNTRYDNWKPMPSGLNSTVRLVSGNI